MAPLGKKRITFRNPLSMPTIRGWLTRPIMTNIMLSNPRVVRVMTENTAAHCPNAPEKGIPVISMLTIRMKKAINVVINSPLMISPDTMCALERGVSR